METEALIAAAKPIVWRRGYQAGLTVEDREDLLQDVLAKYLQAWPDDGRAPSNVAAWIETTTSHAIVDRVRADARHHPVDNHVGHGDDPVGTALAELRSTQFASASVVRRKLLRAIFALIPTEDADLLQLRYLHDRPAADVAAQLGITVANLDQRTTRAKRKLRTALEARPDLLAELRAPHPHVY
ncbi:MAG: sigma-70 family RNA polymerase sigma factor [Actinobacteria bacterium]|nr:sigma-70 family RNA polymerase sigma factor [Actinomycetota bacterium]